MNRILCLDDGDVIFVGENGTYWEGTFDFISALVNLEVYNCEVKYIDFEDIDSSEIVSNFEDIHNYLCSTEQEFKEKFNLLFESIYGYFM